MAIEKKIVLEEHTMQFYFSFGADVYGGVIDMRPFDGKLPDDLTEDEKKLFLEQTLYGALLTLRELQEDTPEFK